MKWMCTGPVQCICRNASTGRLLNIVPLETAPRYAFSNFLQSAIPDYERCRNLWGGSAPLNVGCSNRVQRQSFQKYATSVKMISVFCCYNIVASLFSSYMPMNLRTASYRCHNSCPNSTTLVIRTHVTLQAWRTPDTDVSVQTEPDFDSKFKAMVMQKN
jgi:hypothetical protein